MCERVQVMYAGTLVETGTADQIFARPRHPYTLGLLQSMPRLDAGRSFALQPIAGQPRNMLSGADHCPFAPRCRYRLDVCSEHVPQLESRGDDQRAACFTPSPSTSGSAVESPSPRRELRQRERPGRARRRSRLVPDQERARARPPRRRREGGDGVSLTIERGETLGLVGESDAASRRFGRAILRLYEPTSGRIVFDGRDITAISEADMRDVRRRMQMIFQDPYASLNPRHSVEDHRRASSRPRVASGAEVGARVRQLLEVVGLPADAASRLPARVLGRSAPADRPCPVARAEPELLVCDEPVSALDVSIQAQIINLMEELQRELGLTYLFHRARLAVVRHISTRIA